MLHLSEGTLRRFCDDPLILSATEREHFARCVRCQERHTAIVEDARGAAALLAVPETPCNAPAALHRFQTQRAVYAERSTGVQRRIGVSPRLAVAVGAIAALGGALAFTPAGSLAQNVITIFQPQQVTAISVSTSDIRLLSQLRHFGTLQMSSTNSNAEDASSAADASRLSGMQVLTVSPPAGVTGTARYGVLPAESASFTFSSAKAQLWAGKHGKTLPAMPSGIDGSTLTITTRPAAITVYPSQSDIPQLVIGQMPAPSITSTKASAKEIEQYLLSLPGISPQLAAEIGSLGDPTSTLPIPIPVNKAQTQTVQVQGVQGVAVGDNTGLGSAVIWEKDGVIYGVGGTLPESEVISLANALHP